MASMRLTLPSAFIRGNDSDALVKALRDHVDVDDPQFSLRKAVGVPAEFIELIGDWKLWEIVLGVPASAFFGRFGYRLADSTYDLVREWLKRDEAKPLADISTALADAAKVPGVTTHIVIGLDVPNERAGTILVIREPEPAHIAHAVAGFVTSCQNVALAIAKETAAGKRFAGPAIITLLEDGVVSVQWTDISDFSKHEIRALPKSHP
jgi:hypothetical protein